MATTKTKGLVGEQEIAHMLANPELVAKINEILESEDIEVVLNQPATVTFLFEKGYRKVPLIGSEAFRLKKFKTGKRVPLLIEAEPLLPVGGPPGPPSNPFDAKHAEFGIFEALIALDGLRGFMDRVLGRSIDEVAMEIGLAKKEAERAVAILKNAEVYGQSFGSW
ncbi:hypothetical protein [Ectothiorhodospira shaposhnikovii]|uniref:hypothetical protein n=1 Tax=Ectothiorhodospira shaposhnikovii TaxID=1054 RepID=UPI001EE7C626|nr:hypothetical protein [Ectothiorhodospira shaposhnikovii]MCG5512789.1 hypothetical protein [Ectothiorhodospira shaposhnikovii]